MSRFSKQVLQIVEQIPMGKVVSYGQIAAHLGVPRGARAVGWILRSFDSAQDIAMPWWRVINNLGRISIKGNMFHNAKMQKELLEKERIAIKKDFTLNIEKYRYQLT